MAKTVSAITLLSAPAVAAASAGTKGAPGAAGAWTHIEQYEGGDVGLSVKNGGAVGAAGNILIQTSPDNGTTVFDYWGFAGDLVAYNASTLAGHTSNTIKIDLGVKYIRVIGYGHTTNPVDYTAIFTGVVRS